MTRIATPRAPGSPAAAVTWETFAITDWRWLVSALAWALALLVAMRLLPWAVVGYSGVLALSLLAAVATASMPRIEMAALPAATVLRYALVDATFVAFAVQLLFAIAQLVLMKAGLSLGGAWGFGLPVLSFVFVCGLYACWGVIGHCRAATKGVRRLPELAGALVALLLLPSGYQRYVDHAATQRARDAGVAAYEQATGKKVSEGDRLPIGNSLHGFDNRVVALAIDREGRLLASGHFHFYAGRDGRGLVRLLPDGRLDASFAAMPVGDPGAFAPSRLLVAADGSVLINRTLAASPAHGLARLGSDGTVDSRFKLEADQSVEPRGPLEALALQADGRLVARLPAEWTSRSPDTCVVRVNPDGTQDRDFAAAAARALRGDAGASPAHHPCSVGSIAVLPSGQLLVQGSFAVNDWRVGVVRLNADGSLDASYRTELGDFPLTNLFVLPTGEAFAAGILPVPGSSPVVYEARCLKLQADGRLDPTFKFAAGSMRVIDALAVQPDGKLIVAGSRGPKDYGLLLRLLPDGSIDPAFGAPDGAARVDGFVFAMLVQPDGRIVVGGEFREARAPSSARAVARFNIVRLNADGSLDTTFEPR